MVDIPRTRTERLAAGRAGAPLGGGAAHGAGGLAGGAALCRSAHHVRLQHGNHCPLAGCTAVCGQPVAVASPAHRPVCGAASVCPAGDRAGLCHPGRFWAVERARCPVGADCPAADAGVDVTRSLAAVAARRCPVHPDPHADRQPARPRHRLLAAGSALEPGLAACSDGAGLAGRDAAAPGALAGHAAGAPCCATRSVLGRMDADRAGAAGSQRGHDLHAGWHDGRWRWWRRLES